MPVESPTLLPESPKTEPEYTPVFTSEQKRFLRKVEVAKQKFSGITNLSDIQKYIPTHLTSLTKRQERELMPEIFALAGKAIELSTGLTPRNTQYATALDLRQGKIAETRSGEGKTLAVGIATIYAALTRESTHVITANDYLAARDLSYLGEAYNAFDLKAGMILSDAKKQLIYDSSHPGDDPENFPHLRTIPFDLTDPSKARQEIYGTCNIIHGSIQTFIVDEELDNLFTNPSLQRRTRQNGDQRISIKKATIIVDEVDQIAIDHARNPIILSDSHELTNQQIEEMRFADHIARKLIPPTFNEKNVFLSGDYEVKGINQGNPWIEFTQEGFEKILVGYKLSTAEFLKEDSQLYRLIYNATLALATTKGINSKDKTQKDYEVYQRGRDYIVTPDKMSDVARFRVVLMDKYTDRPLPDTVIQNGLHQALEVKEGLIHIRGETTILDSISIQSYLRSYEEFSGTTGTAIQARDIFHHIYGKDVDVIPPFNKPQLRVLPAEVLDTSVNSHEKILTLLSNIVEKATANDENNQPFLICAANATRARELSRLFEKYGIVHNLLTGENLAEEAHVIAQAGKPNHITIATFVAGRGTHIELGGEKPPKDSPLYPEWKNYHDEVIRLGGLYVIAADVPPSERELLQVQRRAGRNGNPGVFQITASYSSPAFTSYGIFESRDIAQGKIGLARRKRNTEEMIHLVQEEIDKRNADDLEIVVHTDAVLNRDRMYLAAYQKRIIEHPQDWLKEDFSTVLEKSLHQHLKPLYHIPVHVYSDPNALTEYINNALTIPPQEVGSELQPAMHFITVEEVNTFLQEKAKAATHQEFYTLLDMSPHEQEKVILEAVRQKFQEVEKTNGAEGVAAFLLALGKYAFFGMWHRHLTQLQDILANTFSHNRPLDAYASRSATFLDEEIAKVQEYILLSLLNR